MANLMEFKVQSKSRSKKLFANWSGNKFEIDSKETQKKGNKTMQATGGRGKTTMKHKNKQNTITNKTLK